MNITFFSTRYYNDQIKIINKKKNFCIYINKCDQYCNSTNPIYCYNCLYLIESEPNLNFHFSDYILINNYNNDYYHILRNSVNNNFNKFNDYNNFYNDYYYNESYNDNYNLQNYENNEYTNYQINDKNVNNNFDDETISSKSHILNENEVENSNYNFDEETISSKSHITNNNENEIENSNYNFDDETNSSKSHIINENKKEITNEIEITNNNFDNETNSSKSHIINENEKEITNNNFTEETIISNLHIINENDKEKEIKNEIGNNNLDDKTIISKSQITNEVEKTIINDNNDNNLSNKKLLDIKKLSKQEKNKLKKKRKNDKKKLEKIKEDEEKKLLEEMQNLNKINLLEKFNKLIIDEKELKIINTLSYKELSDRIKKPIIYDIKNKLLELYNIKNPNVILNMQIYDDFKDFELSEKQSVDKIVSYLKKSNFNRFYFNSIYELIYFNKLIIFIKDKNGNILDTEISKNNDEVTFYEEILEKEINEYFRDYMIKVIIIPFIKRKKEELKNKYQEYEDKLFKKKVISFEENLLINYRGMIKIEGNMYFGKKGIFKFDKDNNVSKFYYN